MKELIRKKLFEKHYLKRILPHKKLDAEFERRLGLFLTNQRGYPLDDHALTGKLTGKRAFSITADVRVIYEETETTIIFLDIGTHAQVYK